MVETEAVAQSHPVASGVAIQDFGKGRAQISWAGPEQALNNMEHYLKKVIPFPQQSACALDGPAHISIEWHHSSNYAGIVSRTQTLKEGLANFTVQSCETAQLHS